MICERTGLEHPECVATCGCGYIRKGYRYRKAISAMREIMNQPGQNPNVVSALYLAAEILELQ